jgi:hypothetical protein
VQPLLKWKVYLIFLGVLWFSNVQSPISGFIIGLGGYFPIHMAIYIVSSNRETWSLWHVFWKTTDSCLSWTIQLQARVFLCIGKYTFYCVRQSV